MFTGSGMPPSSISDETTASSAFRNDGTTHERSAAYPSFFVSHEPLEGFLDHLQPSPTRYCFAIPDASQYTPYSNKLATDGPGPIGGSVQVHGPNNDRTS